MKPLSVMETLSPPAAGGAGGVSIAFAAGVVIVPAGVVPTDVAVVVVSAGVPVVPGVVVPGVAVSLLPGCTHPAIMMPAITMRARIPNILFMGQTMFLSVDKVYP